MRRVTHFRTSRTAALLLAAAAAAVLGPTVPAGAAEGGSPTETLLRDLSAEGFASRERALTLLLRSEDLTAEQVRPVAESAPRRARPLLARLIGERGLTPLGGLLREWARSVDPTTMRAAVRALVRLGGAELETARSEFDASPELLRARMHLVTLSAQRDVERALLERWQRKQGTYNGQYSHLAELGWPCQPILFCMLLDVPLEDAFVDLPEAKSPLEDYRNRRTAMVGITVSDRRGYEPFDPLPPHVNDGELFFMASQALADVGDMTLIGDILEAIAVDLQTHNDNQGWRLRRFEEGFASALEDILASRGRPRLLDTRIRRIRSRISDRKRWMGRRSGATDPRSLSILAEDLNELAATLHRRGNFDEAERIYAERIAISESLTGGVPAVPTYNRACALARAGKPRAALKELERAFEAGIDDLTREWVTVDGDLRSLHDDPEFQKLVEKYYGPGPKD